MRRKRNQLIIVLTLTGVLFYFLQIIFVNTILMVGQNVPDLLLILTLFIGYRLRQIPGSLFGFVAGFFQDVLTGFYGLQSLCKTLMGYGARSFLSPRVHLIEKFYFPFVVLVGALAHDAVFYAFQSIGSPLQFWNLYVNYAMPNALYSAVMTFILWMIIPNKIIEFVRYDVKYDW